jgi:hypothetical protein
MHATELNEESFGSEEGVDDIGKDIPLVLFLDARALNLEGMNIKRTMFSNGTQHQTSFIRKPLGTSQ